MTGTEMIECVERYQQALEDIQWMSPHEGESYPAFAKRLMDRAREALASPPPDPRCKSIAFMSTGVYRCVYESGHMREGVGPQAHYYNYDRACTPEENEMFKDAPPA